MKVPEEYRLKDHPLLGSDNSYGNNGFFIIPHHRILDYYYTVQASDGLGWDHISVSIIKKEIKGGLRNKNAVPITKQVERCCTWEEMCYIKSLFFEDEETAMQLHPPKSMWVNNHPYCLHLWKPLEAEIPLPEPVMVGYKELNKEKNITT